MSEVNLQIGIPAKLLLQVQSEGLWEEELGELAQRLLAVELYRRRLVSVGQAAEMTGLEPHDFYKLLLARNVPLVGLPPEESTREMNTVERMLSKEEGA